MYLMFIKPIIDSVFKIDELKLKINSIFTRLNQIESITDTIYINAIDTIYVDVNDMMQADWQSYTLTNKD